MADTDFSRFVPGFDFLQGLMKNAGAAIPGFNQWVAPTLDPQELDKRIDELRTVQFWLEQNARMLAATIQALEVQRMTLSTLHAMNVPMADLKEVLKTPMGGARPATAATPAPAREPEPEPKPVKAPAPAAAEPGPEAATKADAPEASGKAAPRSPAGADPMQWWNALTQQFTQVAANAMKTAQSTAAAATSAATSAAAAVRPAAPAAPAGAKEATRASTRTTAQSSAKSPAKSNAKTATARAAKPAATSPAAPAAKPAAARKAPARRKTS